MPRDIFDQITKISSKCSWLWFHIAPNAMSFLKRTASKVSGVKAWTLSARTVAANDKNEAMAARTKFFLNMLLGRVNGRMWTGGAMARKGEAEVNKKRAVKKEKEREGEEKEEKKRKVRVRGGSVQKMNGTPLDLKGCMSMLDQIELFFLACGRVTFQEAFLPVQGVEIPTSFQMTPNSVRKKR